MPVLRQVRVRTIPFKRTLIGCYTYRGKIIHTRSMRGSIFLYQNRNNHDRDGSRRVFFPCPSEAARRSPSGSHRRLHRSTAATLRIGS